MPPPPPPTSDFPRGGAASAALTSLELRAASEAATKELFENGAAAAEAKTKKSKKRAKSADAAAATSSKKQKTDDAAGDQKPAVRPLTFKKLQPGFGLIGVVKTITDLELLVSLPNQMTGSISITEISDEITRIVEKVTEAANEDDDDDDDDEEENEDKMDVDSDQDEDAKELSLPSLATLFRIGQALPCVAISAAKEVSSSKRKIELSIKPQRINASFSELTDLCIGFNLSASVKSVEDNGYILDFGFKKDSALSAIHGFLHQKHATAFLHSLGHTQKGDTLSVGQFVYCTIIALDASKRTISVSAEPTAIAKAVVPGSHNTTFSSLKPGLLIPTRVKTCVDNGGVIVSFMNLFEGNIELSHLGEKAGTGEDLDEAFKAGMKLQARILISCCGIQLKPQMSCARLKMDPFLKGVQFPRVDGDVGLVLDVGVLKGYVHELPTPVRVIGYDLCDSLLQLSMKPSVLGAAFVRREDVKPGMLVSATITQVEDVGLFAQLADGISALVPTVHLAEGAVSNPAKKFKIGSTIKARVLVNDIEKGKIALTLKKPLVESQLPILSSYDPSMIGQIVEGFITAVKDFGCLVGFYNKVHALCPKDELSAHKITNPADIFTVGQVVKCKIYRVNEAEEKMNVSFKRAIDSVAGGGSGLKVGEISTAKIVGVFEAYALVSLSPSGVNAFLEKQHVSDHQSHIDALFAGFKKDQVLGNVVVVDVGKKVKVSMKHSLISYQREHGVSAWADKKAVVGKVVPGFIRKVTETGCEVEYVGGSVGVVKAQAIADRPVANATSVLRIGQTVFTRVVKIYEAKENEVNTRADVSLKPSGLVEGGEHDLKFMEGLFLEQERLQGGGSSKKENAIAEFVGKFPIGSVVTAVVKQKAPSGFLLDVEKGAASGLLTVDMSQSASIEVGATIKGRVVDIDYGKKMLDVKLIESSPEEKDKKKKNKKKIEALEEAGESDEKIAHAVKQKHMLEAAVEVVKADYVILSIPSLANRVVFAPIRNLNSANDPNAAKNFRLDQKVKVTLLKASSEGKKFNGLYSQRVIASLPVPLEAESSTTQSSAAPTTNGTIRTIKGSLNDSITCLEDVQFGMRVNAKILAIKSDHVLVALGDNLKGRVHTSELADSLTDLKDTKTPFSSFKIGTLRPFKVVGTILNNNGTKNDKHKYLPVTHTHPVARVLVELTCRKKDMDLETGLAVAPQARHPTLVAPNTSYLGYVTKVEAESLWVSIGPNLSGRVVSLEISNHVSTFKNLAQAHPVGSAVNVLVLKQANEGKLDLSIRGANTAVGEYPLTVHNLKEGVRIVGKVTKVGTSQGLSVVLGDSLFGKVSLFEIADDTPANPTEAYKIGQFIGCRVISVNKGSGTILLTARKSLVEAKSPDLTAPFKKDLIVKGYIKNISESGLFVDVGYGFTAFVHIKDLSDDYLKEWKSGFALGDVVTGKITNVEMEAFKIKMSLKRTDIDPTYVHVKKTKDGKDSHLPGVSEIKVGMKVAGSITAVTEHGVHIKVDNMNVKGLCHVSELSDKPVSNIESLYAVGDPVMAYVIKVDLEKNRCSFSLKASHFSSEDVENEDDDDEDEDDDDEDEDEEADDADENEEEDDENTMDVDEEGVKEDESDDDQENNGGDADDDEDDENVGEDDEDDEMAVSDDDLPVKNAKSGSTRKLAPLDLGGAGWGHVEDSEDEGAEEDDDSDDDDETTNNESRKSKREKKRAKQEEEDRIAQQEQELLETKAPDSAEAFERILMGSPNSSFLWIKFMAFHLQMAEIQKAREVGERALKSINFRDAQELMNVWVALLNLENTYGDRESLIKVFERAVAFNEPKAVYLNLASIYERSENFEELDALFKVMAKRFKESCKIWVAYGVSLLKRGNVAESRKILQRSLLSLAKRKHLKVVCKFAQMEFRHGEVERGRTLFEGIVSHHPKGWICGRRLFERTIALKLSSKKMKFLFKKYLEFEKSKGTPEGVKHVKEAAMEFTSSPLPPPQTDSDALDVWADKKLISILDHFDAPIRCAAGYGSGVFKQMGYDDPSKKPPMVDLIFGVSHPEHWHYLNIKQNPSHYSFLAKFGAQPVAMLQEKVGAGLYYNTDVLIDGMRIKYGVISMKHLIEDLTEWNNFYVAGRLQKPIKILRGDSRVKLSNDQNLLNALRVALLLLPQNFTEKQLYTTIVQLSYLGDFRMTFGENPKKIENIVNAQMLNLRILYRPVIERLGSSFTSTPEALKVNPGNGLGETIPFEQDWDVQKRGGLLLELPKGVRGKIVSYWQTENGFPSDGMPSDVLKGLELAQKVVSSGKIEQFVKKAITNIVGTPALTQSMKGFISAGPAKSFSYIGEKLSKRG
ncbi:mitochondrial matrix Mmp37-domain-containing protein [Obelidium mucronatum]|nr:mitochondrial matrix Mmp37-domain-containing protein [Obelidium mucronatum]